MIQQIAKNVSSSEFTFTIIVKIIISVFLPRRSRVEQIYFFSVFVRARDRPGIKTEMIIVTLIAKVNAVDGTLFAIGCIGDILSFNLILYLSLSLSLSFPSLSFTHTHEHTHTNTHTRTTDYATILQIYVYT
jgi:hypothetical protein